MSECDDYCLDCMYCAKLSGGGLLCNYYLVCGVGNRRGCPAGEGCERKIVGERVPTIEEQLFHGKKEKPRREYSHVDWGLTQKEKEKRYREHVAERIRSACGGRQREVIVRYLEEHKLTEQALADAVGISKKQLQKWKREVARANWEKLALVGIQKPEGL